MNAIDILKPKENFALVGMAQGGVRTVHGLTRPFRFVRNGVDTIIEITWITRQNSH